MHAIRTFIKTLPLFGISVCLVVLRAQAQEKKPVEYKRQWQIPAKDKNMLVTAAQQQELYASEEEMKWYKDAKFGIFVHWGPALLATNVLSWGRFGERPGANKKAEDGVPPEIYDNLYKQFNPVNFDADKWMEQIKSWGANYLVFVAKHHDGFCMFDAPNSNYDIANTPFKRDICKEIADAAHRHGIKLFWYYSQPDWTHPDCLREKHYENYLPYMKEQVKHLFTQYGKIDGVFWDHLATQYYHWDSYHLYKDMKAWQPGIITNPRMGFGWPIADVRGDYDTPEQSLGPINHSRYWEACLTMTDKWLYSPNGPIKPAETIIGMLVQVIGNGGNLLLNLGPNEKGEFVPAEAKQADQVGRFLQQYGSTLYNTRRGIYIGGDWGASTQTGNKLYLHILEKIAMNADPVIELPNLPMAIVSSKGITPGFIKSAIKNNRLLLTFDKKSFAKNLDNIVELTLAESPDAKDRIETWTAMPVAAADFDISSSSFSNVENKPEVIFGNKQNIFSEGVHLKSWWQPAKEDASPTLTLLFHHPEKIKTVLISENMRSHIIRNFTIESKDTSGNWKIVFQGNTVGEGLRIKLSGESINGIRIQVKDSESKNVQLTAFNVYR